MSTISPFSTKFIFDYLPWTQYDPDGIFKTLLHWPIGDNHHFHDTTRQHG
ncbi:MAG: hypothetical protein GXY48_05615 [Methanomicrobiales archaeon]|nr:hypothetical protein [Methanomicrobiales archaeon]